MRLARKKSSHYKLLSIGKMNPNYLNGCQLQGASCLVIALCVYYPITVLTFCLFWTWEGLVYVQSQSLSVLMLYLTHCIWQTLFPLSYPTFLALTIFALSFPFRFSIIRWRHLLKISFITECLLPCLLCILS